MRCLCFQLCQNHRTIMLRMPGSPNGKVRILAIKIHLIPLKSEDFFSPQSCVQPQHHKHIRRQAVNGIQQLIHRLLRHPFGICPVFFSLPVPECNIQAESLQLRQSHASAPYLPAQDGESRISCRRCRAVLPIP